MADNIISKIIEIPSFDGYIIKGKLVMPKSDDEIAKLILFVHGSGPNTYNNHRKANGIDFDYFDFYAQEFAKLGIAFFSYNTRGVELGESPPYYANINDDEYKTYLPTNTAKDLLYMIRHIKQYSSLKKCKVLLLGWSEGTIIAPIFADKYPYMVDGLLLAGYVNDNMKDVLIWQNSGGASMVWYRHHFDKDKDGRVSKAEYEADPHNVVSGILQNTPFESIDINGDGYIDENDMMIILKDTSKRIFDAIYNRDDEWLKNNYPVRLTSDWFLDHFNLKSNMELVAALNLPIYIFHGTIDRNCDVNGVYKIRDKFIRLGKNNLKVYVLDNHNHDLNYMDIILKNEIPFGIMQILKVAADF